MRAIFKNKKLLSARRCFVCNLEFGIKNGLTQSGYVCATSILYYVEIKTKQLLKFVPTFGCLCVCASNAVDDDTVLLLLPCSCQTVIISSSRAVIALLSALKIELSVSFH